MTVVLATHNPGKKAEIQEMLAPLGWEVKTLTDLNITEAPEETGETFLENARIKARAAVCAAGLPALADDSGLCVAALDGAPGVHSAYYGGFTTDGERNAHLLREMDNVDNRAAYFICVMSLCYPDGREISVEGRLDGEILRAPRGDQGFGYDPVFALPEKGRSLAELPRAEKSALSHRGQALRALTRALSKEIR